MYKTIASIKPYISRGHIFWGKDKFFEDFRWSHYFIQNQFCAVLNHLIAI